MLCRKQSKQPSKQRFLMGMLGVAALSWGNGLPALAQAPPPVAWTARYRETINSSFSVSESSPYVALDAAGNVYVAGFLPGGVNTSNDYATIKYDPDGNQLWLARYNGPANGSDVPTALALDASGNVYVTGSSSGLGTNLDYATIKYDADGNQLWVARYSGPTNRDDRPTALALDASGNVYVTGTSDQSFGLPTSADYATIKYDPDGNQVWLARYNGPGNGNDFANALAMDGAGNVFVTGFSSRTSVGNYDYATIKYDADGNQLWLRRYGPFGQANALAVDVSGNVYVTGSFGSYPSDFATVKYDADGTELWARRYNGPNNLNDVAGGVALDRSGNVVVAGTSVTRSEKALFRIAYAAVKYDAEGNQLWVQRDEEQRNGTSRLDVATLAVDAFDNVFVTGVGGILKYAPDGRQRWRRGGANALALDGAGNVYVTRTSARIPVPSVVIFDYETVKYASIANLRVSVADVQRTSSGGVQLTLRLNNVGDAQAAAAQLTSATLQGVAASDAPLSLGTIAVDGSATATLTFPGTFSPSTRLSLRVRGLFNDGSFAATQLVTLPTM